MGSGLLPENAPPVGSFVVGAGFKTRWIQLMKWILCFLTLLRPSRAPGADTALTLRECTTIESETFQSKRPPYISESSILTLAYEACGT